MKSPENKEINVSNSKEWLNLVCDLLRENKSISTQTVSKLLGVENTEIKKENRTSKFLIPFNKNLKYIAINPDLEPFEMDCPITYLSFCGKNIQLKLTDLISLFPNFKLVENTYDGGFQIFFHPIKNDFDFKAISCQLFENKIDITKLDEIIINNISFLFKPNKIKTRAGYTMVE